MSNSINDAEEGIKSLREAIKELNGEIPEFTNGLQDGLTGIAKKLPGVVESMRQLSAANRDLVRDGHAPKNLFKELAGSMLSWNTLISVGVTLLITYGGQLLDWISSLNKGKDALAQAKARFEALNKAIESTEYKTAITDVIQLKTAIQTSGKSVADKTRIVDLYNNTLGKTMGQLTSFEQVENRIKTGSPEYIKWTLQKAAANYALTNGADKVVAKEKEIQDAELKLTKARHEADAKKKQLNNLPKMYRTGQGYSRLLQAIKDSEKEIEILTKSNQQKQKERDKEIKNVTDFTGRFQQEADKIAKAANFTPEANTIQKNSVEWIRDQIAKTEKKKDSGKAGSAAFKEMQQLKKQLAQIENTGQGKDIPTPAKPKKEQLSFDPLKDKADSIARMAQLTLEGYAKEVAETNAHFDEMKQQHTKFLDDYEKTSPQKKALYRKEHQATLEADKKLEEERLLTLNKLTKKFQNEEIAKLTTYENELLKINRDAGKNARELALQQLEDEFKAKNDLIDDEITKAKARKDLLTDQALITIESDIIERATQIQKQLVAQKNANAQKINTGFDNETKKKQDDENKQAQAEKEGNLQNNISALHETGHEWAAMEKELELLKLRHDAEIKATDAKGEKLKVIEEKYAKQKAQIEDKLTTSKIHAGDRFIDAALKNSKKDSAIYKAAFLAKKATSIADTIISTKRSVMESLKAYSGIPFIGQALGIAQAAFMAAQGAMSIAEIAKQKPGFAQGGQYTSDGRGALLPGYSRTDNTNAYLRSGEAVVVSEAMRNPWARNLVSAINVAYGGRDFSVPNPGNGYAIGGVFTDGGNASRYYSQPMNDQKDLANTLAYQMLNNFPPIYVDVKDVNNQQNILAQTVNRVNL